MKTPTNTQDSAEDFPSPFLQNYVLLKNTPPATNPKQIREIFPGLRISNIKMFEKKSRAFVEFERNHDIQNLIERHSRHDFILRSNIEICPVTKIPLDLNKLSKILIVTFFTESVDVDVGFIKASFPESKLFTKIIVFRKFNQQAFIEF